MRKCKRIQGIALTKPDAMLCDETLAFRFPGQGLVFAVSFDDGSQKTLDSPRLDGFASRWPPSGPFSTPMTRRSVLGVLLRLPV